MRIEIVVYMNRMLIYKNMVIVFFIERFLIFCVFFEGEERYVNIYISFDLDFIELDFTFRIMFFLKFRVYFDIR